jgi:hypothetical protein
MSVLPDPPPEDTPRDAAYWAQPVSRLKLATMPMEAIKLNVEGRHVVGPLQGFGQLWQKTYRVRLAGVEVSPQEVIKVWKTRFAEFWPSNNRFYSRITGIAPGEVAVLDLAAPGGMRLSTGVMVVYADDDSFAFMTPEGHMFAALITFSAYQEDGVTFVQIQPIMRANDPIYEMGMRLGLVHRVEDKFWHHTLQALAAYFGVPGAEVEQVNVCLDRSVQWSHAKNIWHNAAIRTGIYTLGAPLRWGRNFIKRQRSPR